ncbi:MAG: hypothetical protein R3337_12410 [Gammaproteobacteria bacterium]|nr:hypothetical protein [Gammaproteobacteria bacterium]
MKKSLLHAAWLLDFRFRGTGESSIRFARYWTTARPAPFWCTALKLRPAAVPMNPVDRHPIFTPNL